MFDRSKGDQAFAEKIAEIHGVDSMPSDSIREAEMDAMFDAYLGADYDKSKKTEILELQRKLHLIQARLYDSFEKRELSSDEYVDKFNNILKEIFSICQSVLGKSDFLQLFGTGAEEMQGFIDKESFLADHEQPPALSSAVRGKAEILQRAVSVGSIGHVDAGFHTNTYKTPHMSASFVLGSSSGRGVTVLIVDDSNTYRTSLQGVLQDEGFNVLVAGNSWDALGSLNEISPDVMLVDVVMPLIDGFELVKLIHDRPETSHMPVVMMTAGNVMEYFTRAQNVGANIILSKSGGVEKIVNEIRISTEHR